MAVPRRGGRNGRSTAPTSGCWTVKNRHTVIGGPAIRTPAVLIRAAGCSTICGPAVPRRFRLAGCRLGWVVLVCQRIAATPPIALRSAGLDRDRG